MHQLSIRRNSIQIILAILLLMLMAILGLAAGTCAFENVHHALIEDVHDLSRDRETALPEDLTPNTDRAITTARILLVVLEVAMLALAAYILYKHVVVGIRLEDIGLWVRRLGRGDLEYRVEPTGDDEVTEAAIALEELRLRSKETVQLDLVEKLSREIQEKDEELERVLAELQQAQDQVVLRQKLVELGELTAGIAHEIRNPLSFVKNFTMASEELLEELGEALDESADDLDAEKRTLIADISKDLTENLERIRIHGDRVNRIVRSMLMIGHGGGERREVDINELLRENAMLAYQSLRASDHSFQLDLKTEFDENAGEVSVVPEDFGRVFINMVSNACYALDEKRRAVEAELGTFVPTLSLTTKRMENSVEVRIRDNGTGIPPNIMEKMFSPFFTTKPSGKGTGLGLSLSNDIVRRHGGSMEASSVLGEYTEMVISLPTTGVASSANT
ncbi:MAG: ATP-binding protein [Chloroflexi bacterium]|nr:ATP-binding protein [Chloroflexota bacterium]